MIKSIFQAIILTYASIGCASNKANDSMVADSSYQSITSHKLSGKISYVENKDESFVLCKSYEIKNNVKYVSFLIYDLSQAKITFEPKSKVKDVNWTSNNLIKVVELVGMPNGENTNNSYTYDVIKKRKINILE